jgi:hypothetical protein
MIQQQDGKAKTDRERREERETTRWQGKERQREKREQ